MAVLASKDKQQQNKKLPSVGLNLMQEIITGLRVAKDIPPSSRSKFSGKKYQNNPPPPPNTFGAAPSSGKSWICDCNEL